MPNYRMMHMLMDDFVHKLGALVGNELIYYKNVFDRCKRESSRGDSLFLKTICEGDMHNIDNLREILKFYGYPAIDCCLNDIVVPYNLITRRPYLETASLISLELMIDRFEDKGNNKHCLRLPICDRNRENDAVEEFCANRQWQKKKDCLFKGGIHSWQWDNKHFSSPD